MNSLLKINYETDQPTVSARDLYDVVSSDGGVTGTERFSKWFERYVSYGFREGIDFSTPYKKVRVQLEGSRDVAREVEDYDLTIDMAKQVCMLQRTEKGAECRQYFIDLEKAWNTPEQIMARALKMADRQISSLIERNNRLLFEVKVKDQQILEMKPKATYYDLVLQCPGLLSMTAIAKDYGKSAEWMNRKLHEIGIQYKQGGVWFLYQNYAGFGYTHTKTHNYPDSAGNQKSKVHMYWTQKGRLFIYDTLRKEGIVPMIEMQ